MIKVVNHKVAQHHNTMILTDVYVRKTIMPIQKDRDKFPEEAIEISRH